MFFMTSKIDDIIVSPNDSYFFDTNVWIFIFAPVAQVKYDKQKKYSNLLRQIKDRNALIWINSLVISEYINSVLRLEFKMWKERTGNGTADYKRDFRCTQDYLSALIDVKQQVNDILSCTERRADDFNNIKVKEIIDSLDSSIDFGDAMIVDMCRRENSKYNNIKLVTDDKDITNKSYLFQIITA